MTRTYEDSNVCLTKVRTTPRAKKSSNLLCSTSAWSHSDVISCLAQPCRFVAMRRPSDTLCVTSCSPAHYNYMYMDVYLYAVQCTILHIFIFIHEFKRYLPHISSEISCKAAFAWKNKILNSFCDDRLFTPCLLGWQTTET